MVEEGQKCQRNSLPWQFWGQLPAPRSSIWHCDGVRLMHTDITNTNTDTLAAGVDIGSGDGGAAKMVKTQADTRNK